MASDRAHLAALLDTAEWESYRSGDAAAYILAAGWRPPARVIETREELYALPVGSLVGDIRNPSRAYIRNADVETRYPGWTDALDANTNIDFEPPVLLLWEPKAGDHA